MTEHSERSVVSPSPAEATAGPSGRWWRDPLVLVLVGVFVMVVVANMVMLRTALVTLAWSAFDLDSWCSIPIYAQTDRPDATAWRLTFKSPAPGANNVRLRVMDETGKPLDELWVAAVGFGSGTEGRGIPLAIQEEPSQPGVYYVLLPKQWRGEWRVEMTLTRGLLLSRRTLMINREGASSSASSG